MKIPHGLNVNANEDDYVKYEIKAYMSIKLISHIPQHMCTCSGGNCACYEASVSLGNFMRDTS